MDVILELNDSVIFPNISCSQNFIICTFLFFFLCYHLFQFFTARLE